MTTASIDTRSLPRALKRGLGKVDRRIRAFALVRGIGVVALVLASVAAIGMAADFAWPMPMVARWAIWGGWIAAGTMAIVATVVVPIVRRVGYADLAAVAERGNPGLGERLTSAVALMGARVTPHGSPALIAALGEEAGRRAADADLTGAVSGGRAVKSLLGGLLAACLVVAPAVARPDPFAALGHRFLMPWADVDRVARLAVEVKPGDAVVAIGSDVAVVATVKPRFGSMSLPEAARLEWTGEDKTVHQAAMSADETNPADSRTFRLTVPRLAETVRYRVVTDAAESRKHRLTAVEPPAIATLVAGVEPPAYTKLPAFPARNPARIEAWEGSTITISLTANKPLKTARIDWPAAPEARSAAEKTSSVALGSKDGTRWTAKVPAAVSGNYTFVLEDEYRIPNRPEPPRRLVVKPDMPPTIAMGGSDDLKDAQADDLLVTEVLARDDLAVMTAELLYAIERTKDSSGPANGQNPIELKGLGTRRAQGEMSLGLKALALHDGDILTYRVKVTDSLPTPKGPNVTLSPIRSLRIVAKADPLLARERSIERQSLQDQLNAIKKAAAENRHEAEILRYAADAAQRGNGAWGDEKQADLARREAAARSVVDKLQLLARDFADSGQFAPLERPTRQIADVEAEAGREKLDDARQANEPAKRLAELRAADDRLAAVQVRLDELQRRFDELARLDDDRRKLRELAEKQDELAKKADELAESGDRAGLEKVQQEQDRMRAELDELARRSPELRAEALAARAKEAEDLARRARDLAARQREEARKTADPTGRAEKLKSLAEAQRRLEDDARRLALQVDRPLEENGRARLNTAALASPIEPIERGEIEPARQTLEGAEETLRRLSRELDDVRDDPKALARRLAKRQDVLNNQVAEMVREARDPDQKKALAAALKPMAERQDAIGKLAAAIPVPENLKGQANEAVQAINRSREDLSANKTDKVQAHQNEARDRLNRLAEALPDINQKRQQALQAMHEAKSRTDQVANELENHLRETAPRPNDPNFDPEAAARDLARRVAPLAERQAEAARLLAEIPPDRPVAPQHERALERVRNLADALDALRSAAPPESKPSDAKPAADWRILGPFEDARKLPPFAIDRPIDFKAPFKGRKGEAAVWKPVQSGENGRVDLGAMYTKDDNQSAFAYAEIASPVKGRARLLVGSDDFLTIWVNGKIVYECNNSRSYSANQDRVDVMLEEGPNRLLARCGNGNAEWIFSVSVVPPRPAELAKHVEQVKALREALPALKTDATAAVERLQQKMYGQEPADDRAADLAADLKEINQPNPDTPAPADEMRRVATALRNLAVPDALAHQAEAVRQADRAAKASAENAPDAAKARQEAARATEALAKRLIDSLSPREQAAALAQAQKGLNEPDAQKDPQAQSKVQKAIADALAAMPANSPEKAKAVEAAQHASAMTDRQIQRPESLPAAEPMVAARAESAKAIDALAQATDPAPPAAGAKPANDASPRDQARALAERQRALAQKANELSARAEATPKDDPAAQARNAHDLAAMANDQKAIAEAVKNVNDPLPANTPPRRDAEKSRDQARAAQAQAAGAMAGRNPARAAEKAQAAAEALDRLAQGLPETNAPAAVTPPDPELALNADHARQAQQLARRERQIRERLQTVLGERVAPQEKLRDETAALGRSLAELRDGTRDVSAKSQGPAAAAADMLQHQAPAIQNESVRNLASGKTDPARESQRRAAETIERAAQQAEDLAAALRSEVPADAMAQAEGQNGKGTPQGEGQAQNGEAKPGQQPSPADLASARDAQRQASQQLAQAREAPGDGPSSQSARAASNAMRQAAKGLRAAAATSQGKSSAKSDSQMAKSSSESSPLDPKEAEAGRDAPHLAALKESIKAKTGRNWGELPGHLRSEILQMSQGKYRDDYARLIQLYFREIAAGRDEAGERRGKNP
ncbi:MAG: hypothetical protein JWN86_12 [Planctomycetota bacterium]|nr:hypothetical protein [Planctomycetota bacterium]